MGTTAKIGTRFVVLAATLAMATLSSTRSSAYTFTGPKWNLQPVPYVINSANLDLPEPALVTAVRAGADTWQQQSGAAFSFAYAGPSSQSNMANDGTNLVVFRNASGSSPGVIATTYWYSSGSQIIDADIVFWDGAFQFFAGSSGCSGGFYIEDIAAHEFGHALGLGHSTSTLATMYPSVSFCNTGNRTLDADDIAGVQALYPPSSPVLPPSGVRIVL